jgi:hypothetical protein
LRHQSAKAFSFSLPLIPVVHDAIDVRKEEFFCIARNRSSSMRNSFISRRIAGSGSDASGNFDAEAMRVRE